MLQVDKPSYFFMHVGKTGGTYASNAVRRLNKQAELDMVFGAHRLQLPKIVEEAPNARVIFGLRKPLEIFVSGFFSRQRKGEPTHHAEWSNEEEKAFTTFGTPNDLAEALSAEDTSLRRAATRAMNTIQHVKKCLHFYLESAESLERHRNNVFFILDQEHLDDDLDVLFSRFDLAVPAGLREKQDRKHRNPSTLDRHLSAKAIANLENHYANDLEIYRKCKDIRDDILLAANG